MIEELMTSKTVGELFMDTSHFFIIPRYQRNYSWTYAQQFELFSDIINFSNNGNSNKTYHLGNLILMKREEPFYEVIDGQQRLTTIYIILKKLNMSIPDKKLEFQLRNKYVLSSDCSDYKNVCKAYSEALNASGINDEEFIRILNDKVTLMLIEMPKDTDVAHYFEVMNSRGKQLEKHEIFKARLLGRLKDEAYRNYSNIFNAVWNAASDMFTPVYMTLDNYNIQWNELLNTKQYDQERFCSYFNDNSKCPEKIITFIDAIGIPTFDGDLKEYEKYDDQKNDYTQVIKFAPFLMHVIRLMKGRTVPLNDAILLEYTTDKREDEKYLDPMEFAFVLLKVRYIFDRFIIKNRIRDYTLDSSEDWSLLTKVKYENKGYYSEKYINTFEGEINTRISKLEAVFHCSLASQNYKNWLYLVLYYLFYQCNYQNCMPDSNNFIEYLRLMQKNYMYHIYLSESADWTSMINNLCSGNAVVDLKNDETINFKAHLNKGTELSLFVFNYIDWLLDAIDIGKVIPDDIKILLLKVRYTTSNTSVEHYFPRNNMNWNEQMYACIDSIGNLSLLSPSTNSSLGDIAVGGKKEAYRMGKAKLESLKQGLMLSYLEWDSNAVINHEKFIIDLIKCDLVGRLDYCKINKDVKGNNIQYSIEIE